MQISQACLIIEGSVRTAHIGVTGFFLNEPSLTPNPAVTEETVYETAEPLIRRIVRWRIGTSASLQDQEDVKGDVLLELLSRIGAARRGEGSPILDLPAYASVAANHGCDHYLRRRFPLRHRLSARLRYLLAKSPAYAIWESSAGEVVCGYAAQRGTPPNTELPPDWARQVPLPPRADEAAAVAAALRYASAPLRIGELVDAVAVLLNIHDDVVSVDQVIVATAATDPGAHVDQRRMLERLWSEIVTLPLPQRVALLLNLRDDEGACALTSLPATGVASMREIARVLEMPAEELAGLWRALPLSDLDLAARLSVSRQQVINLRKAARERLIRRTSGNMAAGITFQERERPVVTEHMSSAHLIRYARGEASPAELLAFDDHLSQCAECRARLPHSGGLTAWAEGLRVPADEEKHLTHDQLIASVENRTPATEEFEVERHLSLCPACREDAAALLELRQRLTPQARTRWWIPAAIAAALIVGTLLWRRPTPVPTPASTRLELSAAFSAEERALVQQALNDGALSFGQLPAELQAAPGTLLGTPAPESFALVEPVGAIVYSDRPVFRWQLLPGAVSYRVEIYDANFQLLSSSPMVTGDSWKATTPLPRGVAYRWQVTASKSGSTVTAPAPPAPEARFQVLDSDTAKRIARADSQGDAGHLLAAVLFAQSGMRADANHELDALDPALRARPEVRRLID